MKIRNLLISIALLASGTVNASTVFNPEVNVDGTLENVDFFYLGVPTNYTLGLFDAADGNFTAALLVNTGNAVSFDPNLPGQTGPYTATNDQTAASINISSTQGNSAAFILGLRDDIASTWFADSGAVDISGGAGKAFSVSFTNPTGGQTWGIDMILAPVPVPAAVWLFGSGLLGMIAVARRRRV